MSERRYTEYARTVMALTAIGKNPCDVDGFDLIEKLCDVEKVKHQGINGPIFALTAMEKAGEGKTAKEEYIDMILNAELKGGGFSLNEEGEMNVDISAMAVCALSPYMEEDAVCNCVKRTMRRLHREERTDATYGETGREKPTPESTAQVILAMCMVGENPSRQIEGLEKAVKEKEMNDMCAVQVYMALAEYEKGGFSK